MVTALSWSTEASVDAERALGMGRAALAAAGEDSPVVVHVASLAGDGRALGAYQRPEDALSEAALARLPLHRRETGGPTAVVGEGIQYAALALANASVLLECPRDRVLNRNVRPFLAALRTLGAAAHYFGREALSLERRPAGLLGWTRRSSGAVLVELVLGVERPAFVAAAELGVPVEQHLMGKAPVSAGEVVPAFSPRALAEALVEVCAKLARLTPHERALSPLPTTAAPTPSSLRWSSPRAIPIGVLRAGLALDTAGMVEHAALAGDFYQDAEAPQLLHAALVGGPPTPERFRDALNATYGPERAVIEGVRSLQPALEAFLELAE